MAIDLPPCRKVVQKHYLFFRECVSILYPLSRCIARISAPEAKVCEKGMKVHSGGTILGLGAIYMLRETFIILEKNNSCRKKSSPETLPFFFS